LVEDVELVLRIGHFYYFFFFFFFLYDGTMRRSSLLGYMLWW